MLLCRDHRHPDITNFTCATVLRFCGSAMNDGHDAIFFFFSMVQVLDLGIAGLLQAEWTWHYCFHVMMDDVLHSCLFY